MITIKLKLFYLDSESDLGYGSQTARNSKTVLDPSQCLHTLLLSAHLYLAKLDNEMHIRDILTQIIKWCLPSGEERQSPNNVCIGFCIAGVDPGKKCDCFLLIWAPGACF